MYADEEMNQKHHDMMSVPDFQSPDKSIPSILATNGISKLEWLFSRKRQNDRLTEWQIRVRSFCKESVVYNHGAAQFLTDPRLFMTVLG